MARYLKLPNPLSKDAAFLQVKLLASTTIRFLFLSAHMIRKITLFLLTAYISCSSHAVEIFNDGEVPTLTVNSKIGIEDTIAGYPIFLNDGNWQYVSAKIDNSTGRADSIKMASLLLFQREGKNISSVIQVVANMGNNNGSNWSGEPCAPNHLVVVNKGRGREDHCLTIDPVQANLGNGPTTFLEVRITNNASAGRFYFISLALNLNVLGVKDTATGDWTTDALRTNTYRKYFLDKVTSWAEMSLEATMKLSDYAKPQDVFKNIPPIKTLQSIPAVPD